jgi:fructose-1,6-bisphosphatase/inositol monophosphatase family enzyme
MKLTTDHLMELAKIAIEAARKAGKHISETRPIDVQHKASGDTLASQVVTEVDQQAQDIILQTLEPTFAEFDLALLTEESEDNGSRLKKDYFWCIDPIDGTLPFIHGIPGYAVSIALVSRDGVALIGVVFDPVEQTLYHAIKDQGAYRNGRAWETNSAPADRPLWFITDLGEVEKSYYEAAIEALKSFGYPELKTKTQGGAVMNACWVLENAPACYFKFPKAGKGGGCFWDFAATACIYKELGAVVSDIRGRPLNLNNPDSIYMNHCGVLFATDPELAQKVEVLFKKR